MINGGIFYGYFSWKDYTADVERKEAIVRHRNMFLNALQNVPQDADIKTSNERFYISTDNLKDEAGNQHTFKWGDFELISLDFPHASRGGATAVSLTQPTALPDGIQCGSELNFSRKKSAEWEDTVNPELFQFSDCQVKKISFHLNEQEIQLNNMTLYYRTDTEKGYEPDWIELTKQAAAKLNLNEYWFVRLEGQAKIEKEWNASNISIIFNSAGTPIALVIGAQHPTGLNNMKLKQCFIKLGSPLMILTHFQNKLPTLLTNGLVDNSLSPHCPSKLKVELNYSSEGFNDQSDIKTFLENNFSYTENNVYIGWNKERFYSLESQDDNYSFFLGSLKIKKFRINEGGASVYLADESPIRLGNFTCQDAYFKHKNKPLDNSLSPKNFTLLQCIIDKGELSIENNQVKINKSWLTYFNSDKKDFKMINDFKETEILNEPSSSSLLLTLNTLDLDKSFTILNIAGYPFSLKKAVVNTEGEVISLLGTVTITDNNTKLEIRKCPYIDIEYYAQFNTILTNFSESEVDVLMNPDYDEPTNSCKGIQRLPYKILPFKDSAVTN